MRRAVKARHACIDEKTIVPDDEAARRTRLCEAILQHLRVHERAADTADGIVSNWLPAAGLADARADIEGVLKDMTQKNLLRAHLLPGGELLYTKGSAAP